MKKLLLLPLLCSLAACVSAVKVESGDRAVGERLTFNIDGAWNQINAPGMGPAQVWTMEGLPVDQLRVYSGIKDGEAINASGTNIAGDSGDATRKSFNFRSSMQPDEIVSLFEGMLTRDGSTFKLDKLGPAKFGGGRGFRFDYSLTRKIDGVQLSGIGYATVDKGQLFAIIYLAPRLTFFPRHKAKVEQIAQSAKLKGLADGCRQRRAPAPVLTRKREKGHEKGATRKRERGQVELSLYPIVPIVPIVPSKSGNYILAYGLIRSLK